MNRIQLIRKPSEDHHSEPPVDRPTDRQRGNNSLQIANKAYRPRQLLAGDLASLWLQLLPPTLGR